MQLTIHCRSYWRTCIAALFCVLVITACAERPSAYALATAHPLATSAGAEILQQGGNAFDAAITVSAVLAVVEPYSSGFGGGGFWLLHRAADHAEIMLDGRERAPISAHHDMYLNEKGEFVSSRSLNGPLAAGIPGMPAALVYLAEHYGRLPLSRTLAPAIQYAREGFPADERLLNLLNTRREIMQTFPSTTKIFLPNGKPPKIGQMIIQSDLAKTIERLADGGMHGFYAGETAMRLVNQVKANGGIWELSDLSSYRVIEREPIRFNYRGATVISAAPPSSGGIVLAEVFNIISNFDFMNMDRGEKIHHLVEAMRLAYRDRAIWIGDTDFVEVPITKLIGNEYAKQLAATIDADQVSTSDDASTTHDTAGQDTTHFSIIDHEGNRVAATLSINYPFGSGFIADGTGVLLNNEMDDFSAKPGTPNVYGLVGGTANAIEPGKRMLSSMSPTFVDDGERIAVLGTPGGSRIITMVALAILEFLDGGTAEQMVSAKRFHHQYLPDEIQYESATLSLGEQTRLRIKGHSLKEYPKGYGNMNVVIWDYSDNLMDAASDPRGVGNYKKSE